VLDAQGTSVTFDYRCFLWPQPQDTMYPQSDAGTITVTVNRRTFEFLKSGVRRPCRPDAR
jgi:hypothetical protein